MTGLNRVTDFGLNSAQLASRAKLSTDFKNFTDLIAFINSKITSNSSLSSNQFGNVNVFIPAGDYIVTDVNLFNSTLQKTQGLTLKGAGREVTRIQFSPSSSNQYLFNNNDKWMQIHFEDMSFYGDISLNTNFMLSTSNGGAQNYTFERCNWTNWNFLYKLEGTNNNSEMSWYHCGFYGQINKGLYASGTDGSTVSDQFLNYNFFVCNFEVNQGDFIDLYAGGNVNIWGGSYIHYGANAGTFFSLKNSSHSYGTERFLCIGARFEHRNSNSKLIYSEWASGNIQFLNCDMSAEAFQSGANTWLNAIFLSANVAMPNIKFSNCRLMGQHQYQYKLNSYQYNHKVTYEDCEFNGITKASDFILYNAPDSNGNGGGKPPITFRNCKGSGDSANTVWDCVVGYDVATLAVMSKKILSVKNPGGAFPPSGSVVDFYLPLNAIITAIKIYSPANAVSQTVSVTFGVQTTEATPTVLATVTAAHNAGFNVDQALFFKCDSDTKRHLQLTSSANATQPNYQALCIIEYIG